MLSKEEYNRIITKQQQIKKEKVAYQMTDSDLKKFERRDKLPSMIADRKMQNDIEKGLKALQGYDDIEETCLISITSLKKSINGSQKVTRTFLYKFAVGLHMSIEEANEYFALCGGILHEDSLEDAICQCALRDGDDIYQFVEEYERLTGSKIAR